MSNVADRLAIGNHVRAIGLKRGDDQVYMSLTSSNPARLEEGASNGGFGLAMACHCSSLVSAVSMSRIPWKYSSSLALSVLPSVRLEIA